VIKENLMKRNGMSMFKDWLIGPLENTTLRKECLKNLGMMMHLLKYVCFFYGKY
jgi:hypothetical protein